MRRMSTIVSVVFSWLFCLHLFYLCFVCPLIIEIIETPIHSSGGGMAKGLSELRGEQDIAIYSSYFVRIPVGPRCKIPLVRVHCSVNLDYIETNLAKSHIPQKLAVFYLRTHRLSVGQSSSAKAAKPSLFEPGNERLALESGFQN
jgi:hypothetical protein